MRTRFAGAGVLVLLLAACDGMCGPLPATPAAGVQHGVACVDVKAPHHAYVVVQHASGAWIQRCVGFAPGFIDAPTAMERAGIIFTTQPDEAHTICPIPWRRRTARQAGVSSGRCSSPLEVAGRRAGSRSRRCGSPTARSSAGATWSPRMWRRALLRALTPSNAPRIPAGSRAGRARRWLRRRHQSHRRSVASRWRPS